MRGITVTSCVSRAARGGVARLSIVVLALAASTAVVAVSSATAAVTPTKDALALAQAIAGHPAFIVGAEIETAPQ